VIGTRARHAREARVAKRGRSASPETVQFTMPGAAGTRAKFGNYLKGPLDWAKEGYFQYSLTRTVCEVLHISRRNDAAQPCVSLRWWPSLTRRADRISGRKSAIGTPRGGLRRSRCYRYRRAAHKGCGHPAWPLVPHPASACRQGRYYGAILVVLGLPIR
jgi:hypothetical protein